MNAISYWGRVELEWAKINNLNLQYTCESFYFASLYRRIDVLNWWKLSGLPFKPFKYRKIPNFFTEYEISKLPEKAKVNEWWYDSNYAI
jgi:hypothetical protein